jgi:hypothetical protein
MLHFKLLRGYKEERMVFRINVGEIPSHMIQEFIQRLQRTILIPTYERELQSGGGYDD